MHYVAPLTFPRPQPPNLGWLNRVVDQNNAAFGPAIEEPSYVVAAGPSINVDLITWPQFSWVNAVTDARLASSVLAPVSAVPEFRVGAAAALQVSNISEPFPAWLPKVVDNALASSMLAPVSAVPEFLVGAAAALQVHNISEPAFSWSKTIADAVIASWGPGIAELRYRVDAAAALQVGNIPEPSFAWDNAVVDALIATGTMPALPESYRLDLGPQLNTRHVPTPSFAWLTSSLPAVDPTQVIAVLDAMLKYRVEAAQQLNVQSISEPGFAWDFSVVDALNAQFFSGINVQRYRAGEGQVLDVKRVSEPAFTWDFSVVDAVIASAVMPTVPLSYRTGKGKEVDVAHIDEPGFAWVVPALPTIDPTLVIAALDAMLKFRVDDPQRLNVLSIPEPGFGWDAAVVNAALAQLAGLHAVPRYRVGEGGKIDVGQVPTPSFAWDSSVVNAILASWSPVVALDSFCTPLPEQLWVRTPPNTSWITVPLTPAFNAALTPSMMYERSYVVGESAHLNVTRIPAPPTSWLFSVVDQLIGKILPAFPKSYRVREGRVVDVARVGSPVQTSVFSGGDIIVFSQVLRTTQLIIEVVIRPQPLQSVVVLPPPVFFDAQGVLQQLTGAPLSMEIGVGYIGNPPVKSQLQRVRANYTEELGPLFSELHCYHVEQMGEADTQGQSGTLDPKTSWFTMRQTNRYHRICLVCEGDTEVTAIVYALREAGIR